MFTFLAGLAAIFLSVKEFNSNCSIKKETFEQSGFQVKVISYSSSSKSEKSVLIIPPTGKTNVLDRSYAHNFCKKGLDVFILDSWTGDDEHNYDLQIHERFYSRAQKAIGIVLSKVETPFVGILGTSVGALHGSLALGQYEKIKAGFLITGGAPIAEVIVFSDQKAMEDAKAKRYGIYGFKSDEEYLQELSKALTWNPLNFRENFKGKTIGLVVGTEDKTVPLENQRKLQNATQPSKLIELEGNHMMAIIKTWLFHRDDILDFFLKADAKN